MSREIRSRRAVPIRPRPLYARVLGLQYVRPSSGLCFLFFEGTIAFTALLALAELVEWWAVAVPPVVVAVLVKINDAIAGALAGPPGYGSAPAPPPHPRESGAAVSGVGERDAVVSGVGQSGAVVRRR